MKESVLSVLLFTWVVLPALAHQEETDGVPASIQFEGNRAFADQELLGALRSKVVKLGTNWLTDLKYDLEVKVGAKYRNNGYINVKFGAHRIEDANETEADGQPLLRIVVPVQEGPQFIYGSLDVEGVAFFSDDQIASIFSMAPGDVVNMGALKAALGELKYLYGNRSFLTMEAIPIIKPNPEGSTLAVRIEVTEGKQYLCRKVQFELSLVDNPSLHDNEKVEQALENAWLMREGQPCNTRLVEESINRINSLGYFEPLEEKDWEFIVHRHLSEADIVVRLTQRQE